MPYPAHLFRPSTPPFPRCFSKKKSKNHAIGHPHARVKSPIKITHRNNELAIPYTTTDQFPRRAALRMSPSQQATRRAPAAAIGSHCPPLRIGRVRVCVRVRVCLRVRAPEQSGWRRLSLRALQRRRECARDGRPVYLVEGAVSKVGVAPAALRLDFTVAVVRPTARSAHLGIQGGSLDTQATAWARRWGCSHVPTARPCSPRSVCRRWRRAQAGSRHRAWLRLRRSAAVRPRGSSRWWRRCRAGRRAASSCTARSCSRHASRRSGQWSPTPGRPAAAELAALGAHREHRRSLYRAQRAALNTRVGLRGGPRVRWASRAVGGRMGCCGPRAL